MRARDDAEALILSALNSADIRGLQVGREDGGPIVDHRRRQGFKGKFQILLRMTPLSACKGLKNFQAGVHLAHNCPRMRTEGELRIEGDAENLGVPLKRDEGAIQENLRVVFKLVSICRKEGDRRFFRSQVKALPARPFGDGDKIRIQFVFNGRQVHA